MFYLSEHFASLQGEGKYAGTPSYFLRTGGCNMTCAGFGTPYSCDNGSQKLGCDTYFAVDTCFKPRWQQIESVRFLDALDQLEQTPHVVITGGEPLLYANDKVFYEVVCRLLDMGKTITFETNCTIAPDFENYPRYKECVYAMSIKLSNSGESEKKRLNPRAVEAIAVHCKESFFKFTLDKALVEGSAKGEIDTITGAYDKEIFCMPVGADRGQLWQNDKSVFAFCLQHGFRYCDRLHIRVFDDTHGV